MNKVLTTQLGVAALSMALEHGQADHQTIRLEPIDDEPIPTLEPSPTPRHTRGCPECGRPFQTPDALNRHVENYHRGASSICDKGVRDETPADGNIQPKELKP